MRPGSSGNRDVLLSRAGQLPRARRLPRLRPCHVTQYIRHSLAVAHAFSACRVDAAPHVAVRPRVRSPRRSHRSHCFTMQSMHLGGSQPRAVTRAGTMPAPHAMRPAAMLATARRLSRRRGNSVVVRADADYYSVLGVAKDADKKAIKTAYRQMARKFHPVSAKPTLVAFDRRLSALAAPTRLHGHPCMQPSPMALNPVALDVCGPLSNPMPPAGTLQDVNKEAGAEARFKKIGEAYEVCAGAWSGAGWHWG